MTLLKKLKEFFCIHDFQWYSTDFQGRRTSTCRDDIKRTAKRMVNASYLQCSKCDKMNPYDDTVLKAKEICG